MHDESSSVDAGKGTCHFLAAPVLTPPLNTSPSRHHALTLCASGSSVLLLTSTILSTDALESMISEWTALTHARSGVIQEFVVEVNPRARSGTGRLPFCSPAFPLPPSLSLLFSAGELTAQARVVRRTAGADRRHHFPGIIHCTPRGGPRSPLHY